MMQEYMQYHPDPADSPEAGNTLPDPVVEVVTLPIEDELAAAEIARAHAPQLDLPESLRAQLVSMATDFSAQAQSNASDETETQNNNADPIPFPKDNKAGKEKTFVDYPVVRWAGIAAGIALIMVVTWFMGRESAPDPGPIAVTPPPTIQERLAKVDDRATYTIGTPTEAGYEQVTGEFVWSDTLQTGYMKLKGVPVNKASEAQYQLWIVKSDRYKHPVDGGVFDINEEGEVIVPIDAKLAVNTPDAFAITLEQPGGVVVSDGPLLIVAAK